jgi:hypothetical protein
MEDEVGEVVGMTLFSNLLLVVKMTFMELLFGLNETYMALLYRQVLLYLVERINNTLRTWL